MKYLRYVFSIALISNQSIASESPDIHFQWLTKADANACILDYVQHNGSIYDPLLSFITFSDKFDQKAVIEKFPPYKMHALSYSYSQNDHASNNTSRIYSGLTKQIKDNAKDVILYLSDKDTFELLKTFKKGEFIPIAISAEGRSVHITTSAHDFEREYNKFDHCVHTLQAQE